MCGIAGLLQVAPIEPSQIALVKGMLSDQRHRGPDDTGLRRWESAILGHCRLSIVDLSKAGHQPMCNEDGTHWLTFNGEIYNSGPLREELLSHDHVFQSRSDTEVLLHGYEEWGIDGLLSRLQGMFAFALRDGGGRVYLARDPLGIKPLYYSTAGERLVFASEVKAIRRSGVVSGELDRDALIGFLLAGSVPSPRTITQGIECLPPGHYLEWAQGTVRCVRYWDLPDREEGVSSAEIRASLLQGVSDHLMSDVPVGIFLSGGVDSASVLAAVRRVRSEVSTLTVTFDEQEFSEGDSARRLATHFQAEHHEIRVDQSGFLEEIPRIFQAIDQPTNDGVNSYFVSKAAKELGLKVVLSGLGGDEVFWGYKHYAWLSDWGGMLQRLPGMVRFGFAGAASAYGMWTGRENFRRLDFLSKGISPWRVYLAVRGFFAPEQVSALAGVSRAEVDRVAEELFQCEAGKAAAAPQSFNYLEFKRYLHDQLLRDSDVFSMAHSIELRVPLLHTPLVELLAQVEGTRRCPNGINKPLLVEAIGEEVVRETAARPKKGFSFPMRPWMMRSIDQLQEMAGAPELDSGETKRLWGEFTAGRLHWSRAWALAVLGRAGRN